MKTFAALLVAALLPLPRQYEDNRGWFRIPEALESCIRTEHVQSIPEAGVHQEEAYRLTVRRNVIEIQAVTGTGELRARQTLDQLVSGSGADRGRIRCCSITDWPAFPHRGFLQDCGRSYISTKELKAEIKALAALKINVFHWHLTENQAWRLESSIYPQLNAPGSMTRFKGLFYTKQEVREIIDLCTSLGMKVIPEIDMPGHSAAFERCFGCSMQSPEGKSILKELVCEACDTFRGCEYFHIGTDEVKITDPSFVPEMVELVRSRCFKVMSWNPGWHYKPGEIDAMQLWSYRGTAVPGIPAIDSKLHYLNHFDCFADIRILYGFKPYGQDEATGDVIGSEIALWHDRFVPEETLMVKENSLYPAAAVLAERCWRGGEPGDFAEFEDRFIALKESTMSDLPICYVRQSNVRWGITQPFDNRGDLDAVFPPESGRPWEWTDGYVRGAGVYLRHVWGGDVCPQYFRDPQPNTTVYAWTLVWSPDEREAGLLAEFQNYSRSEKDCPPDPGRWDRKGSRAWLNGEEILPPEWTEKAAPSDNETALGNENLSAREPLGIHLKKGWNTVLLKLPVGGFSTADVRLVKWMFNFVFVIPDGGSASPGLVYDPEHFSR